ncbi:MAG TPA: esterase [Telluria sp.]|jgi:phospholipase/lecithinase/hemolysin
MRQTNLALAILTAAVLSACGGSDDNTPAAQPKPKFASQVSFGDSLSDVGTYKVGTVAALGGGKYTINGNNTAVNATLTGKNWTELMAAQFGLAAPCAAQTGLDGDPTKGFAVPVTNNLACTGYAQGGARVTDPKGPGNKLTGSALGQLTVPVVTQVATHLARNGGKFTGNEVVFVMAGGNDALQLLADLTAAAQAAGAAEGAKVGASTYITSLVGKLAAGATNPTTAAAAIGLAAQTAAAQPGATSTTITTAAVTAAAQQPGNAAVGSPAVYGPMTVAAQAEATAAGNAAGAKAGADYAAANGPGLVPKMAAAGTELANLVRNEIVGKGANYVVLVNLPDLATTPSGKSQSASSQQLIAGMVSGFNIALRVGVDGLESKVLPVDLYTVSVDEIANPAKYGITNTTTPACGTNALGGTSLVCNATNVVAGDVSHYLFADTVHPTPFGNSLIAKYVADQMAVRGWL